jgi:hypothetical protein
MFLEIQTINVTKISLTKGADASNQNTRQPPHFGNPLFLNPIRPNHMTTELVFLFYYYQPVQTPSANISFLRYRYR